MKSQRRRALPLLYWFGAFLWTTSAEAWSSISSSRRLATSFLSTATNSDSVPTEAIDANALSVFDDFVNFLLQQQDQIIDQLERMEASAKSQASFSKDPWGIFATDDIDKKSLEGKTLNSGGITRVLQGGNVIEKGACSLTLIQQGVLTADRANTIRARQQADEDDDGFVVQAGDFYSAAALSMVLHTRSPLIPTFRSDVRIFLVRSATDTNDDTPKTMAWFGGGADLTPYYLEKDDITFFHNCYRDLCQEHFPVQEDGDNPPTFTYESMKKACDEYFYLPARQEHRGTGGIFFDDMELSEESFAFTKGVVNTWMPSWIPIVTKHKGRAFSERQKQWQLLRRGRYLEFNLLYDRGVKFGLANANPRVEGVMVSAPPVIAYEYNHKIEDGSPEAELVQVLKEPIDWATST